MMIEGYYQIQCVLLSLYSVMLTDQNQLLHFYLFVGTAPPTVAGATIPDHSCNWNRKEEFAELLIGLSREKHLFVTD